MQLGVDNSDAAKIARLEKIVAGYERALEKASETYKRNKRDMHVVYCIRGMAKYETCAPKCRECESFNVRMDIVDPWGGNREYICEHCYNEQPEPDTGRPDFDQLQEAPRYDP